MCLRAKERHPLGDAVPGGDGLRFGYNLLAASEGVARGGSVGASALSVVGSFGRGRTDRAGTCLSGFGLNPTDKGKAGTKHHVVVADWSGIPLTAMTTAAAAADVQDSMVFEELIDAIEPIKRSEKLHADKAYEDKKCARALTRA